MSAKYDKENMTPCCMRFHNRSDAKILDKLSTVANKTDYVRQLITADISEEKTIKLDHTGFMGGDMQQCFCKFTDTDGKPVQISFKDCIEIFYTVADALTGPADHKICEDMYFKLLDML